MLLSGTDKNTLSTSSIQVSGHRSPAYAGGIEIADRHGPHMPKGWTYRKLSTLYDVVSNGFPNLFFIGISQPSSTANVNHTLEMQTTRITSIVSQFRSPERSSGIKKVIFEPSVEVEEAWAMRCLAGAALFASVALCTPGYFRKDALK